NSLTSGMSLWINANFYRARSAAEALAPALFLKKRIAGQRLWVDGAQRLVDQLLWAAVKSHTVKVVDDLVARHKVNRIGQTLLFEAAQHVSGQQAFEAGPGSGPYGDENLGKPLRGRCLIWGSTTVSGQITELLVRQHGVSAAVIDNRQQNACPALKYALELGMDPNRILSKGQTNLFGAAKRGDVEKVKAFFYAAAHGGLKVTDLLLVKYKADALIKDNCGRTALQYVLELQNADEPKDVVKLLADAERKQQKAIQAAQKKQRAAAAQLRKREEKLAKAQKKAEESKKELELREPQLQPELQPRHQARESVHLRRRSRQPRGNSLTSGMSLWINANFCRARSAGEALAPALFLKKRIAGQRLWVDGAQRLVDQLLWAAVKSHTVKVVDDLVARHKVNRIGQTLLFEAAQHVSGQQAFEAGPGSGPYGDENLGKPLRGPALKYALELGMDPNRTLSKGQTNLFGAAKRGNVEKVKVLVETHNADLMVEICVVGPIKTNMDKHAFFMPQRMGDAQLRMCQLRKREEKLAKAQKKAEESKKELELREPQLQPELQPRHQARESVHLRRRQRYELVCQEGRQRIPQDSEVAGMLPQRDADGMSTAAPIDVEALAPALFLKKRIAGQRLWVDGVGSLLFSVAFVSSGSGPAQRLVDQLLWAAVKSHTVKVVDDLVARHKVNRIGQTLLFEAAQHVSGQQAFEAGPGSGPYGDENLGKPLRGRCLIWGSTTVSGQITELLVRQHGVSAAVIDNRQQNACFYAAKHGHSQLMLRVGSPWHFTYVGTAKSRFFSLESLKGPALKYALELGMDPNRTLSKGQTNLFGAAKRGDVEKVKVLFETHKADLNHRDEYGQTCLFYAAAHGGLKVTDLLLGKYKADALIKDNCGRTALQYVRELQNADEHQHVVKLLADAERKQQKAIQAAQKKQRAAAAQLRKREEKLAKAQKKAEEQERARAERAAAATRAAAASSSSRKRPSSVEEPAAKRQRYELVCQEGRQRIPQDS
ncbi:unnamed protein product, partial [Cladocopium goreaui]